MGAKTKCQTISIKKKNKTNLSNQTKINYDP